MIDNFKSGIFLSTPCFNNNINYQFQNVNKKIKNKKATRKATLKLKSNMEDMYSDFDMSKRKMVSKVDKQNLSTKGCKYKIKIENAMQVELNGNGPEMQFTAFNGDICVRKGK